MDFYRSICQVLVGHGYALLASIKLKKNIDITIKENFIFYACCKDRKKM